LTKDFKTVTDKPKEPEQMTAYERWELPSIEKSGPAPTGFTLPRHEKVKPLTAKDLERIRQEAYQEGLRQGRENGRVEGLQQGKEQGQKSGYTAGLLQAEHEIKQAAGDTIKRLESILSALLDPVSEQQKNYEQAITNLSFALARSVIHRELHLDSSVIEGTTKEILRNLPDISKGVSIYCSAIDLPFVKSATESFEIDAEIIAHPDVHPGGCRVETSTSVVDHTIEKRFQKAVQAMLLRASASGADVSAESPQRLQAHTDYPTELLNQSSSDAGADASLNASSDISDTDESDV
jgi:flagellar assembly protein FliH